MKNAKKILLLLLSLVLLIGIFAVAAFAEDAPAAATVTYPDGTVDAYTAAGTITPSIPTEDGLYYGKGNTLYKDNSGAGWIYTDAQGNTLTAITEEMIAAGAKITASGLDKVYYTTTEIQANGTSTLVYHMTDDFAAYFTAANTGDLGDGAHTGALPYTTLCKSGAMSKLYFKFYEDVKCPSLTFTLGNISKVVASMDLNGHTLDLGLTHGLINGLNLYISSSKPGAHFYSSGDYAFQPDTYGRLTLGIDCDSAFGGSNISFHCKNIVNDCYGDGVYIHGGNFYQLPGSGNAGFVNLNRLFMDLQGKKTGDVQNQVSFYVQPGYSVFYDKSSNSALRGPAAGSPIKNCSFYAMGEGVSLLNSVAGSNLVLESCSFYGVSTENVGTKGSVDVTAETNKIGLAALTERTVTWADGTKETFYADSLANAKAYVKGLVKAKQTELPLWVDGALYMARNAITAISFDENGNATQTVESYERMDRVYATIDITFESRDYYKYTVVDANGTTKYIKAGESYTYTNADGSTQTIKTVKRPVGSYKVYLYDSASLEKFFSTSAEITLGGVDLKYQDLRALGATYTATIHADQSLGNMFLWAKSGYDRVASSASSVGGQGNAATVYFDLNGHSITGTKASENDMRAIQLYVYSSKPGAHLFMENASQAFYVNDDSIMYLGAKDSNGTYANNLHVHAKKLFRHLDSGGGASIYGGHYYQSAATASALVASTGRLNAVQNASFYVKNGINVFGKAPSSSVVNCKFYTNGTSAVLSEGTITLTNCKFYGVSAEGQTILDAVTYNTVTLLDGTTSYHYYVADSLEEAKAFVESIPETKNLAPYLFEEGRSTYYVAEPNVSIEYDAAFNAVLVDAAKENAIKVYYSTTQNGVTTYVTEDAATSLVQLLQDLPEGGMEIVLLSDMKINGTIVRSPKSSNYYYFDINGHTLTIAAPEGRANGAFQVTTNFAIYSSREGGLIDASACPNGFVWTNDTENYYKNNGRSGDGSGPVIIGERTTNTTTNGKNLTILCTRVFSNQTLSGAGAYLEGGTFVQSGASETFLFVTQRLNELKNTTFVMTRQATKMMSLTSITARNCTFVYEGSGFASLAADTYAKTPTFDGCSFINVLPAFPASASITYNSNCTFGATTFFPTANLNAQGSVYLVRTAASKTATVNGITYELNGALVSSLDGYALVTFKGAAAEDILEYWENGAEIKLPGNLIYNDLVNECLKSDPSITSSETTEAGVTATVAYATVDPWAISYLVDGDRFYVTMSECGGTEKGVGDMFYALFAEIMGSYEVTLYTDLILSKGMGMGPIYTNSNKVDEFKSMQYGNFTLDLNGYAFKTASDLTPVCGSNSNTYITNYGIAAGGVFCFELSSTNTFKITSSRPGARFENNSGASIFLVGEGGSVNLVIDGENITFDSLGPITFAYEAISNNTTLTLDGGTYIYRGNKSAFGYLGTASIKNAEVVMTGAPNSIFAIHTYNRNCAFTVENVKFYSENAAKLFSFVHNGMGISNGKDDYTYSLALTDCVFAGGIQLASSYAALDTLTYSGNFLCSDADNLLIAYSGVAPAGILAHNNANIGGYRANVLGYYAESELGLVDFGFGIKDYWVLNSTASHENATVAGVFIYSFADVLVDKANVSTTASLVATVSGKLQMSLTLQSKIGINFLITEALSNATVSFDGKTYSLAELAAENGFYVLTTAVAPTNADKTIAVIITLDGYAHELSLGIEKYAAALLVSEAPAHIAARDLTYAMIEYVRAMTDDTFCADAVAPAGYKKQALDPKAYDKGENALLSAIAFRLDESISIAIAGVAGNEVNLILATGRSERATIAENGEVIFTDLYVNEFYGDMQIKVGGETYTYSLACYLNAMINSDCQTAIVALNNYAYHADAYVSTLLNAKQ